MIRTVFYNHCSGPWRRTWGGGQQHCVISDEREHATSIQARSTAYLSTFLPLHGRLDHLWAYPFIVEIWTLLIMRVKELGGGSAETTQYALYMFTWQSKFSWFSRPTGNQAIPELRMLPPAQLHIPLRFLADDIGHFYLDREEMGLIQIERPLSRITTRRDYPRVMCVATLVALGLALVTFVGAIIQKTLF